MFFPIHHVNGFFWSYRVCIPDSRTRKIGSRQRHSSRYEFMAHYTQTRHESPTLSRTKISASTIKPWRRHWMVSALKLLLSRCAGTVVHIRFLHSDSCHEAFNVGCCHLVGKMGVQAEVKCLSQTECFNSQSPPTAGRTLALSSVGDVKCVSFMADLKFIGFENNSASYNTNRVGLM
jgi:hypothetical protein